MEDKKYYYEKKQFVKPEIEVVKYNYKDDLEDNNAGHSHCKSPFGHDHSHE